MSSAEYQRAWRARQGARTGQPGRPATEPCGTTAAYRRHQRKGEPACPPCKAAWALAQRQRRQARKG